MKNRLVSALSMFLLMASFFVAQSAPASAEVRGGVAHHTGTTELLNAGVYTDIDYSCVETDPTMNYTVTTTGWAGVFDAPAGMTFDYGTNHLTGTPTTTGHFFEPDVLCRLEGPGYVSDIQVGVGDIVVQDPSSPPSGGVSKPPAPTLTVMSLNNALCEVFIEVVYPEGFTPDPGSEVLTISNPDPAWPATTRLIGSSDQGQVVITHFSMIDLTQVSGLWNYSDSDWNSQACNRKMNYGVTYQHNGVTSDEAVQNAVWVGLPGETWLGAAKEIYPGENCVLSARVQFDGIVDGNPQTGTDLHLIYSEPGYEVDFVMHGVTQNYGDDFRFDTVTNQILSSDGDTFTVESVTGKSSGCSIAGTIQEHWNSLGVHLGLLRNVAAIPLCGKGSFSVTGFNFEDTTCDKAPTGSYVDTIGAKAATVCPKGMTTSVSESASKWDCFAPKAQTVKKLTPLKKVKISSTSYFAKVTSAGVPLSVKASGVCKVSTTKVKKVAMYKLVAGKRAGLCKLKLSAAAKERTLALSTVKTIKVTKTGN